mgnify:CR=1 FL=1
MICPKCHAEYREGFTHCPECDCDLVTKDQLSPEPEPRPHEEPCRLCEAVDEFEAEIIIAKLRSEGIYAFKQFRGSDSYNRILLGRTILGVDIYVAQSQLRAAQEIMDQ